MIRFEEKEILGARTLGDKLRQAREEERLTLETAEKATQIRREYLQALEAGKYEKLPGEVYIKNFLIRYAKFLQLNPERVINLFEAEKRIYQKITPLKKHPANGKSIVSTHPFLNPHFIRNGVVVLAILILLSYLGLEINKIIAPPFLIVDSPSEDSFITTGHSIEVSGVTEKESKILINGQEIARDQDGHFQATVDLKEGINVLKISAVKKNSKENVIYKRVQVESDSS
jgi:cytoskeletal protein RodZ